jgi:hypothetical protein
MNSISNWIHASCSLRRGAMPEPAFQPFTEQARQSLVQNRAHPHLPQVIGVKRQSATGHSLR